MKTLLAAAILICLFKCSHAQIENKFTAHEIATANEMFNHGKGLSTAGWILLGAGNILVVVGASNYPADYFWFYNEDPSVAKKGETSDKLIIAGISMMLTSIPFIVTGAVKQHKARLIFKQQKAATGLSKNIPGSVLGITWSISL